MKRALLLSCVLAAGVPAQTVVTVPNIPGIINVDRPFPGGIGRYQQWYSAASLQGAIAEPMRIEQLEFFAGNAPTSQAAQIDCEILMGHGKFSGVTGAFATNFDDAPIVVKPRALVQLSAGAVGQVVLTLPFTTRFTWDRTRPILLEVRVHGNSLANQPFPYNFRGSTTSVGTTSRVYQGGSVGATTGTVLQGVGMITRFSARPGVVLPFGTGCAGEGNIVPTASASPVPWPGITWTHQLSNAASQRLCLWVIGDTRDTPFPLDLTALLGYPPSNCLLRTNPVNVLAATSVGGGAGGGVATLPIALPGTTSYVGLSVFTQWVVFDPLAPNGVLSVTPALWSIVAPVGG
jgi:hypothetical protein